RRRADRRRPGRGQRRHREQDRHLLACRARSAPRDPAVRGRPELDHRPGDADRRRDPDRGAAWGGGDCAVRRAQPGVRRHPCGPDRRDRHGARRAPGAVRGLARRRGREPAARRRRPGSAGTSFARSGAGMRAVILAAGYATRLAPLTDSIAKQLLPVGGRPMMDWVCDRVEEVADEIHVVTNSRFSGDFRRWAEGREGVVVHDDGTLSNDDRLGAIGDVAFVLEQTGGGDDDLLVIAGDNLFDSSLSGFVEFWQAKGVASAVAVYDCGDLELATHYGVVDVADDDRTVGFEEKPSEPRTTLAATASYLYHRDHVPLVQRYL